MLRPCLTTLLAAASLSAALAADAPQTAAAPSEAAAAKSEQAAPTPQQPAAETPHRGFGHKLLCYIPNRIFDVFDIVRARARLGPGMAVGARVTKYTDLFLGSYASVYLGLPGPRQTPRIPWPGGLESRSGLAASVADGTVTSYKANPRYSATEAGLGLQLILVGAEVGVDPLEVFDFAFGVLFIDFREDDL
jgi:hypothetical protein